MQTATIISIVSATIIIGLSIGVTMYLDPSKKYSSLNHLKSSVSSSDSMITRCSDFKHSLTTPTSNSTTKNNVMNYNIQRMYGECTNENGIFVDLIPMTGCTSANGFNWKLKNDINLDFCPNLVSGQSLST